DEPSTFEAHAPDNLLTLDFADPDAAAAKVAALADRRPLSAVVGVDDLTAVAAAAIAERLGLRASGRAAVAAARDKYQMRQCLAGIEVALEGLLIGGTFHALALFDKPDPLEGPFFEETIYVTPSRLPAATQAAIERVSADACAALGLGEGPVHAELRVNNDGP